MRVTNAVSGCTCSNTSWTDLIEILNAIRVGKVTRDIVNRLELLKRKVIYVDGEEPTDV